MTKTFTFKHLWFNTIETYTEASMPEWTRSKDYKWFLDKHILPLDIGESVETDFHCISRIK